ncbi:hypothetical protein Sulfitobl28_19950 [Sulfitobacter pontiacus]|nr:hypothetical protein Sulfitobl28_19950 [Sulfitobacter pontiacus]
MFTGIFVDDRDEVYAELLSNEDINFAYQGLQEIMDLRTIVLAAKPDIVALDYRLDQHLNGFPASKTFKGGPLAQLLRDAAIEHPELDFPIILVSSENNIRQIFNPDKTAHDLFDEVMIKEELQESTDRAMRKMLALCEAYSTLRGMGGEYHLSQMVGLPADSLDIVDHQELVQAVEVAGAPHIVSRIFAKLLIGRTGLLIDDAELCARFGVTLENAEIASAALNEGGVERYSGLFSSDDRRWWAHQVDAFLVSVFGKRATGLPSSVRATMLNERFNTGFQPALSTWINGDEAANELIAFACSCCRRGTELRHSLAVYEPPQPSFIVRRRLCWDCIQTDNYKTGQNAFEIQKSDQALIPKILAARQ